MAEQHNTGHCIRNRDEQEQDHEVDQVGKGILKSSRDQRYLGMEVQVLHSTNTQRQDALLELAEARSSLG